MGIHSGANRTAAHQLILIVFVPSPSVVSVRGTATLSCQGPRSLERARAGVTKYFAGRGRAGAPKAVGAVEAHGGRNGKHGRKAM